MSNYSWSLERSGNVLFEKKWKAWTKISKNPPKMHLTLLHLPRIFRNFLIIFKMLLNDQYLLPRAYKTCPWEIKTYILHSLILNMRLYKYTKHKRKYKEILSVQFYLKAFDFAKFGFSRYIRWSRSQYQRYD